MAGQSRPGPRTGRASLRGLASALSVAALVVAAVLAVGGTYLSAWFGSVRADLTESPRSMVVRAQHLDEVRTRLGHSGFLQSLALYAETRNPEALKDMAAALDAAEMALRAFETQTLTPPEADLARDVRRTLDAFRKALPPTPGAASGLTGASGAMLMAQHAILVDRIADVRRGQTVATVQQAALMAERGFLLGVGAVGVTLLVVVCVVLLLRLRVVGPAASLRRSVVGVAKGDWRAPVWGIDRADEFGEVARAVDAFREQAATLPDISVMAEDGRLRMKFEGGADDLFTAVTDRLKSVAETVEANSAGVSTSVEIVRSELTGILEQVQSLCLAVARSTADSSREVRQATELLARAARQVSAFDDQGPGGGLDGLVRNLRQNAEILAETVRTTGEEVGYTLKSLVGTENHLRAATAETRETTTRLGEAMEGVQDKLLSAVKLLRASGELMVTTAGEADSNLARAAAAVGEGERSLAIALDLATARFAEITDRMGRAIEEIGARADATESRFDSAVEEMKTVGVLVGQAAEASHTRLSPIVDDLRILHTAMAESTMEVGARAGLILQALEELRIVGDGLKDEFERRRVEPDRRAAAEATIQRLQAISDVLGNRLREVEDTAARLGGSLASGLDDATGRLNDAAAEVRNESRSLAAEAASATNALSRAVQRQEETTESLRDIAAGLSLVNLEPPPPPPPPGPDPELMAGLEGIAALADGLRERLEAMDRLSQDLADATATLRDIAQTPPAPEDTAANAATLELGNKLAEIADQLRVAASGMQSLAANGKGQG